MYEPQLFSCQVDKHPPHSHMRTLSVKHCEPPPTQRAAFYREKRNLGVSAAKKQLRHSHNDI